MSEFVRYQKSAILKASGFCFCWRLATLVGWAKSYERRSIEYASYVRTLDTCMYSVDPESYFRFYFWPAPRFRLFDLFVIEILSDEVTEEDEGSSESEAETDDDDDT
jgi:hypothetical protein